MAEKRLKASIIIGGLLDGSLRSAFTGTQSGFRRVGDAIKSASSNARRMREEIKSLESSGHSIDGLTQRYNVLTRSIVRAEEAQKRIRTSEMRAARIGQLGSGLRSNAFTVGATGASIMPLTISGIRESQKMEQQAAQIGALGVGAEVTRSAVKFARSVKQYGTSQVDAVEMMRDALSVFGSLTEAKIALPILERVKFTNSTLYGQEKGEEATKNFVDMTRVIDSRGGGNDSALFKKQADFIQQVYSVSGGRIAPKEWLDLSTHAGVAGKSMSDAAFYYENMPLINDMGSGAKVGTGLRNIYNHVVQGSNTVREVRAMERYRLIGDESKVQHDKVGQVSHINPGALIGSELLGYGKNGVFDPYQWMKKYLLPTLAKQGITGRSEVLAAIGSIFGGGTGGGLMATMFTNQQNNDRDARMASNAKTVDQGYDAAKQTSGGKQAGLRAQIDDARLALGEKLLGPYKQALDATNSALDKFNIFTARHPRLARDMAIGIGAVTVGFLVAAPAMIVAGSALNAYSGFALLAARREAALTAATLVNTTATEAATVAQGASSAASVASMGRIGGWGRIWRAATAPIRSFVTWVGPLGTLLERGASKARLFGSALRRVGIGRLALRGVLMAVEPIGVALSALVSPIGLAVGALVVGAILVRRHWGEISSFLGGMWKGFSEGVGPAVGEVMASLRPIGDMLMTAGRWVLGIFAPVKAGAGDFAKAQAAGVQFGSALATGLSGALQVLSQIIDGIGWIMRHAGQAISWTQEHASEAWKWMTGTQDNTNAGPLSGGSKSLPEIPQVNSSKAQTNVAGDTHYHSYQITQLPGENSEELARRIHQETTRNQKGRATLFDQAD